MALPYYLYANNAKSSLLSNIGPTDPSITLPNGEGARFPNPTAGQSFMLTIEDTLGNIEIVECTARTVDVLTVTRGREGTLARAFNAGTVIEARHTAGEMAAADWNHVAGLANGLATLDGTTKIPIAQFNTPLQTFGDARWNPLLGFTPIQQGGGPGQLTNKVNMGWSAGARLKLSIDNIDQGNVALEPWVTTAATAFRAAAWATARNIALTGVVTGNVNIDGSANVSLGTSMPANAIAISNVNGLQGALDSKATNNTTNAANITFTGTVTAGAIVDNSDVANKTNLRPMTIERAKSIVVGLTAYDYRHKVLDRDMFGGVAQDMRKTVPEIVFEDGELLGVQYGPLVMPLATMVTYLLNEVEMLRSRVKMLEGDE